MGKDEGQIGHGKTMTLILSAIALAGVVFFFALPHYDVSFTSLPMTKEKGGRRIELRAVLRRAAMGNQTVILTTLNDVWAAPGSIIDLFLESIRTGENTGKLLRHLVIITHDEKAYKRCRLIHAHCYPLKTEGVDFSGEKRFMTEDYLKMVWRKIEFLGSVLDLGYSFIFSDADVMWFRDPRPIFDSDSDFQSSCDYFNGDPNYLANTINTGFKYVRSNEKTRLLFKFWYESRETSPGLHDQDVLNRIKGNQYVLDMGLKFKLIPTVYFSGICQPSSDFNKVCTMHANCCIGLDHKMNDIKLLMEDWRAYKALSTGQNGTHQSKWRVPKMC